MHSPFDDPSGSASISALPQLRRARARAQDAQSARLFVAAWHLHAVQSRDRGVLRAYAVSSAVKGPILEPALAYPRSTARPRASGLGRVQAGGASDSSTGPGVFPALRYPPLSAVPCRRVHRGAGLAAPAEDFAAIATTFVVVHPRQQADDLQRTCAVPRCRRPRLLGRDHNCVDVLVLAVAHLSRRVRASEAHASRVGTSVPISSTVAPSRKVRRPSRQVLGSMRRAVEPERVHNQRPMNCPSLHAGSNGCCVPWHVHDEPVHSHTSYQDGSTMPEDRAPRQGGRPPRWR